MSSLDPDLARIGDQLQARWRVDARQLRGRRRAGLLAAALAAVLAIAGGAIASGVLPIHLTPATGEPSPKALAVLHKMIPAPPAAPKTWKGAPRLLRNRALVIGMVTGKETGRLALMIVPVSPHGVCVDAARPDGSSYLGVCDTGLPSHSTTVAGKRISYYQLDTGYLGSGTRPALDMLVRSAPPGAVRVDVRERDGSKRPSLLSNGWMVALNQHPGGAVALVRFYDAQGRRILSFYG
jgi:hypothetical protein